VTAKITVTEFLQRARECAALAETMDGEDKKKVLEFADDWLKLADEAAKTVLRTGHDLPRK
jgi:hypothetical protein